MYFNLNGPKLVVLAGPTGSGKTAILETLSAKGYPVINLEKLAQHKGSVFGAIGAAHPQPSQPVFEEALQDLYNRYSSSPIIFTEQEAPAIGKRRIPNWFYEKMQMGVFIYLQLPKADRVQLITSEYGNYSKEEFCLAIDRLSERLGNEKARELKSLVMNDRFPAFVDLILDYYDSSYHYSLADKAGAIHLPVVPFDADVLACTIVNEVNGLASISA